MPSDARALAEATSSASDATSSSRDGGVTLGRVAAAVGAACALGAAAYVAYRASRRRDANPGADRQPRRWSTSYDTASPHSTPPTSATASTPCSSTPRSPSSAGARWRSSTAPSSRARAAPLSSESSDESDDDDRRRRARAASSSHALPPPLARGGPRLSPHPRASDRRGCFEGVDVPVEVLPEMREHLTKSCDVGRLRASSSKSFRRLIFRPIARDRVRRTSARRDSDAGASSSGSEEEERWTDDRVWWYADPEANPPQRTAESCRRDFTTHGFVEPERELRRRVAATPNTCVGDRNGASRSWATPISFSRWRGGWIRGGRSSGWKIAAWRVTRSRVAPWADAIQMNRRDTNELGRDAHANATRIGRDPRNDATRASRRHRLVSSSHAEHVRAARVRHASRLVGAFPPRRSRLGVQ